MKTQRQTEMGRALGVIGSIRSCWLMKNPAGTWSFVGAIPAELCDKRKPLSCASAVHGRDENGPYTLASRVYQTRAAGVDDLASYGYAIYNDGKIVKPEPS